MALDIKTLSFALGLTFFIQAIAFFVLSWVIKKVPGIKYWGLGSISITLGFLAMYLRSFGTYDNLLILLGNITQYAGFIFLLMGSQKFVGVKGKLLFLYLFILINFLAITYFTFFDNNLKVRIEVFSLTLSVLLFFNGVIFLRHKDPYYFKSALFVSLIFFFLSLFFVFRLIFVFLFSNIDNFYSSEIMQVVSFIVSMVFGLLWTFGLIIMVTQKMNQQLIASREKLKCLNEEKDTFFSILAHDLRGPFASIINLSEIISEDCEQLNCEQKKAIGSSLHQTALATNELLEDLLEWSGTQRGIKTFYPVETNFEELLRPTFSALNFSALNKQITLEVKVPAETKVFADQHMLQTIFRNLIINAIKFTNERGEIVVQLVRDENEEQVFSVSDNGIGMNKTLLESLFKIGQRTNRQGTKGEISSGLGLLICKEFVEMHNGNIWVISEEGKGSTFFFSIKKR